MSQVPPDPTPPPVELDPLKYAEYPRPTLSVSGDPDRLEALTKGYFGLNWALVVQIVYVFGLSFGVGMISTVVNIRPEQVFPILLGCILIGMVFITIGPNRHIARGLGWKPGAPWLASILMALSSFICCGLLGYLIMQQVVGNELKKFGLKSGFLLGYRRKEAEAAIAQLRSTKGYGESQPQKIADEKQMKPPTG